MDMLLYKKIGYGIIDQERRYEIKKRKEEIRKR